MFNEESISGRPYLNIIAGWGHVGGTLAVRYLRVPVVIGIGAALYGEWALALSISGYAITLEPVLGQLVIREVTANRTPQATLSRSFVRKIDRMYWRVTVRLGIPLVTIAVLYALVLSESAGSDRAESALIMTSVSLSALVYLWSSRHTAIMDGSGLLWLGRLSKVLYETVGFVALLIGNAAGMKGWALVLGAALQAGIFSLVNYVAFKRTISVRVDETETVNSRIADVRALIFTHIASMSVYVAPMLLTGVIAGPTIAGKLSVSLQLLQIPSYVLLPILNAWYPLVTEKASKKSEMVTEIARFLPLIGGCVIIVNGWLLIAIEDVISLWVGPDYFLGAPVTFLLVIAGISDFGYITFRSLVIAAREARLLGILTGMVGFGGVLVSYVLGTTVGISGIVTAAMLSEVGLLIVCAALLYREHYLPPTVPTGIRMAVSLFTIGAVYYGTTFMGIGASAAPLRVAAALAMALSVVLMMKQGSSALMPIAKAVMRYRRT